MVHSKHQATDHIHINETIVKLNEVDAFLDEYVNNAKEIQGLSRRIINLNVHLGTVSAKSRKSVQLLRGGLVHLKQNLMPHFAYTEVSTLLTSCVENHPAVSHFKHEPFSQSEHARFRSNNEGILKEMCTLVSEVLFLAIQSPHKSMWTT